MCFAFAGPKPVIVEMSDEGNRFICFENEEALKSTALEAMFGGGDDEEATYDLGAARPGEDEPLPVIEYDDKDIGGEDEMLYDLGAWEWGL